MTTPFQISDEFTESYADLNPIAATSYGIGGRDDQITDYSPDGHEARADLYRSALSQLGGARVDGPREQFAADVLSRWIAEGLERHESLKWQRDLNHIFSPFQVMRDVFDVMPRETAADADAIRARLNGMGEMVDGYISSLSMGLERGDTVARRQVESVIEQSRFAASDQSLFNNLGEEIDDLGFAIGRAREAAGRLAEFLEDSYLPAARDEDGVGRDEYLLGAEEYLGMELDPEETYQWGWDEIRRIRDEMKVSAQEVDPDRSVEEVIDLLETDPARSAASREEFVEFISNLQLQAIDQLAGTHFEVPEELRTVTVNVAPPGVPLGAWYNGPSEDFSRPGSIWYAPGERERLPYYQEVSTGYHEGFPGHHLQVGTAMLEKENLSRFQRTVIWYSGSGEGWALYAERLMDELGYFEKPEYRLGLLNSQLFRSCRIVVDIGSHLGLKIPDDAPMHAGESWDFDRAVDYMSIVGIQPRDISVSEVKRYLGWYGQAISYKVGEREILDIREEAQRQPDFEPKEFHRKMLAAGAIRLDHLREVML